ncbi:MAG: hypothetical protein EBV59_11065, partial [Synechococcaceae bacterium WB7_1C_051]|nr:hypothetical protein [Synechococcaceae bacterium WB7_1C_051]
MLGAVCTEGFPTAEFSSNVAVFTESSQSVDFTNTSIGGVTYIWNFGDGEFSTEFSPTHFFLGTQSGAEITLTASTAFGCSDSTKLSIGAQVGGLYYIPNAFTPDGDPFNPQFKPLFPVGFDIYNYNMLIYNRWGEVVFETNNVEVGWDGSYGTEGLDAPPGVYTYYIHIKMPDIDKEVFQLNDLYTQKKEQLEEDLSKTIKNVSFIYEREYENRKLNQKEYKDFKAQYRKILENEFEGLLTGRQQVSIRDTTIFVNGKEESYLVINGVASDSITGVSTQQITYIKDI